MHGANPSSLSLEDYSESISGETTHKALKDLSSTGNIEIK